MMPIYTTKCKKCGFVQDMLLRVNEELPMCSVSAEGQNEILCGGELERIPAASNFSFRGGAPTPRFYR